MPVGLFVLIFVFAFLALVALGAVAYVRSLRHPWAGRAPDAAEIRTEGVSLIVLCGALMAMSLIGAGFMVWVGLQVARQHPGSVASAAPFGIALACLLVAWGCGYGVLQERRRLTPLPPEDSA